MCAANGYGYGSGSNYGGAMQRIGARVPSPDFLRGTGEGGVLPRIGGGINPPPLGGPDAFAGGSPNFDFRGEYERGRPTVMASQTADSTAPDGALPRMGGSINPPPFGGFGGYGFGSPQIPFGYGMGYGYGPGVGYPMPPRASVPTWQPSAPRPPIAPPTAPPVTPPPSGGGVPKPPGDGGMPGPPPAPNPVYPGLPISAGPGGPYPFPPATQQPVQPPMTPPPPMQGPGQGLPINPKAATPSFMDQFRSDYAQDPAYAYMRAQQSTPAFMANQGAIQNFLGGTQGYQNFLANPDILRYRGDIMAGTYRPNMYR